MHLRHGLVCVHVAPKVVGGWGWSPTGRERCAKKLRPVSLYVGNSERTYRKCIMHILFVHYSAALLADTPSIGVTRVVLCMTYSFLF